MLSMIAVAAKSGLVLTTCVSSKSPDFAFASRAARKSPKRDVSMTAPVANEAVRGLIRSSQSRRVEQLRSVTADTRQQPADGWPPLDNAVQIFLTRPLPAIATCGVAAPV